MSPKQLKPAPGEDVLASFSPLPETELVRLDRSTVQDWGECPRRSALLAPGKINTSSHVACVGNGAHECFGDTVTEYIDRGDSWMSKTEIAEWLSGAARHSRPDIQPEVMQAIRASTWAWVEFIRNIHHTNILRYDGGEGERSGQLAVEWPDLHAMITSEVDLLYAGEVPEVIHEVDYKCGQKIHLEASVKNSLQFAFHAVLVFANYPDVQELRVSVWNTRSNRKTYEVPFLRKYETDYAARVRSAVSQWYQWRHPIDPDRVPAWPTQEKCRICDAAIQCNYSGRYGSPEDLLLGIVAHRAKLNALEAELTGIVDNLGHDVVVDDVAFGRNKPKKPASNRRASATLYTKE